ncbi:MAG TPA: glycosyltransferase family A protein [Phycisphaerales bacterium]|nr:glycosyltransferase family A protein [Phycisphaerales bacterium]
MGAPSVTFVIPCFNHGAFVAEAVASALAQQDAHTRAVVVNDGSDDATTPSACDALLDRFGKDRLRVIHQPNRGLPAARNAGAREATTDYLAFLDADDWVEPAFVRTLATALEAERAAGRDDVSHAYCQERLVGLGDGTWHVPEWDALLLLITNLHPVTCLVRRDRFEAVGGFDETMTGGYEDWELWVRMAARGWRGVRVPEPLFVWRRHSHSTMIFDAVARHDELYAKIVERNRDHYQRHMEAIAARSNSMLRKFDCNWLDESGLPIPLMHLREAWAALGPAQAAAAEAQARAAALEAEAAGLRAELRQARESVARFESMATVRLSRAMHRVIDAMPGPIAGGARWVLRAAKSVLPRRYEPRP